MVDLTNIQEAEIVPPKVDEAALSAIPDADKLPEDPIELAVMQINLLAEEMGKLRTKLDEIEKDQEKLNKNQQQLVDHVNGWVASIDGVDQTAFMAIYMIVHGELGKKITKEKVSGTHDFIKKAFTALDAYRKVLDKEIEKNRKAIEKNMAADAKKRVSAKQKKGTGNQGGRSKKNTASK